MTLPYNPSIDDQRSYQVWNSDGNQFAKENIINISPFIMSGWEAISATPTEIPSLIRYMDGTIQIKGRIGLTGAPIVAPFVVTVFNLAPIKSIFKDLVVNGIVYSTVAFFIPVPSMGRYTCEARLITTAYTIELLTNNDNPQGFPTGANIGLNLIFPPQTFPG